MSPQSARSFDEWFFQASAKKATLRKATSENCYQKKEKNTQQDTIIANGVRTT